MVLVTGSAGVGKSALVHEVQRPAVQMPTAKESIRERSTSSEELTMRDSIKNGKRYFISGKFDQLKRSTPYAPLIQAFKELIQEILAQSDQEIALWREKLLAALNPNGQVIIDVIPDVELIIGRQPGVPVVGHLENLNRFNYVFEKFITTFASAHHPLVIFLDDLQWADGASLKLIELFMRVKAQYLYLIGAYRDNEIHPAHPLMVTINKIRESGTVVEEIRLQPLKESHVTRLISETFASDYEQSSSLADLCLAKTQGNPFFLSQFIHTLYRENMIKFITTSGVWQWDEKRVRQSTITDNVVELLVSRIEKLSPDTRRLLSLAACIGNQFDLKTLATVYGRSLHKTASDLFDALQMELVIPLDDSYKYISIPTQPLPEPSSDHEPEPPLYRFLHDRVQQAAYLLIKERARAQIHLRIGRAMVINLAQKGISADKNIEACEKKFHEQVNEMPEKISEMPEQIFEIVDQFNLSAKLISDGKEREKVAQLNLVVGKRAKLSAAFAPALDYFKSGIGMLSENSWQSEQYGLTLSLYEEAAEAAYICGQFKEMERLTETVLNKAKEVLDKIRVYEINIQACQAQHRLLEAVNRGLDILKSLGVNYLETVESLSVTSAALPTEGALLEKQPDDLIRLHEMVDPYKLAQMRIMTAISTPLYFVSPELLSSVVSKCVNLSARYGNTAASIFFYNAYGMILCGSRGEIESGFQFGQLALRLSKQLNARSFEARTQLHFNCFIAHWKRHVRETLKPLEAGFQKGVENGDFESASGCAYCYFFHSYLAGKNLSELEQKISSYNDTIKKFRQKTWLYYNERNWQTILNLMGYNENMTTLSGAVFDEKRVLRLYQQENNRSGICGLYLNRLILCYLSGKYGQAVEIGAMAEEDLIALRSMIAVPVFHFYDSLSQLALFPETTGREQLSILVKVARNQKKMKKWADHAPMNHLHKWQLVEAERARLLGKEKKAMDLYDLAIAGANKGEYLQEEALAYELAAKFYLSNGRKIIADSYMREARYKYLSWGAMAKVRDLDNRWPQLLHMPPELSHFTATLQRRAAETRGTLTASSETGHYSQLLDINTIIKSSQAISGEIRFDRLVEKMMYIVIENAGAQKGIFVLEKSGKWLIQWKGDVDRDRVKSTESAPLNSMEQMPATIVQYVIHTRKPLILNSVFNEKQFSTDPYIIHNRPRSLLCLPIIHQTRVIGIVYLENNLTEGAFIPDRLELLCLLSSQIAISIENARLYADLEEIVLERTRELSHTVEELKAAQNQLVESEKMAALGQLTAGIAHEINTPLGVIRASAGNMVAAFNEAIPQLTELFETLSSEKLQTFFELVHKAIEKKLPLTAREERKVRKELTCRLEEGDVKDADLIADTLVDMGVYDNDITSHPFLTFLREESAQFLVQLAYNLSGQQRNSDTILMAVERASKILFALKNYAHYDRSGEKTMANVLEGIETVLTLYHNQLKQGVEVTVRGFDNIPAIPCYPDELNQVWTNLIQNALQAMEYKGRLEIKAEQDGQNITISFTDSGCGIPSEIKERIFDPFFTTKQRGEGSGLGLDICKRIVEKHCGKITFTSEPGKTTFMVVLLKMVLLQSGDVLL